MSNRIYKVIALAILIGAPLIVHIVSGLLPAASEAVRDASAPAPSRVELDPANAEQPLPAMAPPPPPPSAVALVESEPTLDPQGIAPTAALGGEFAEEPLPPPSPSRRGEREEEDDAFGPPPPPRPASMDR